MKKINASAQPDRLRHTQAKIPGGIGSNWHCAKISSGENRRRGGGAMSSPHLPMTSTPHYMTTAQKSRTDSYPWAFLGAREEISLPARWPGI